MPAAISAKNTKIMRKAIAPMASRPVILRSSGLVHQRSESNRTTPTTVSSNPICLFRSRRTCNIRYLNPWFAPRPNELCAHWGHPLPVATANDTSYSPFTTED